MTENRFFTWVWRFNGLLIALGATLIIAMILWETTRNWRQSAFPTEATQVLNVTEEAPENEAQTRVDEQARFGAPVDQAQGGIYAIPQYVEQTYRNRGISKETGGNRVNFLVVDTRDQTQRWLFESGARLITETRALWHTRQNGARNFMGHVLFVIDRDANGDGRLSRSDAGQLLHVAPDWSAPRVIAEGVTHILEVQSTGPLGFDVIYGSETGTTLRQISLPQAEVTAEITLSERP